MVQFSNGGGASIAGKGISNKNEQSAIAGSIAVSSRGGPRVCGHDAREHVGACVMSVHV